MTYGQINFATSQSPNKAMGEKPNPSHTHQVRLFYHELSYIRLLLMIQLQILVGVLDIGHLGSPEVTNRFLLMTHDWTEQETRAWSHCACLVATHRLICNMTYLGQYVTSHDLDLRPNMTWLFKSPCMCFDESGREEHDGVRIMLLAFLVQKLFACLPKTAFLHFSTSRA